MSLNATEICHVVDQLREDLIDAIVREVISEQTEDQVTLLLRRSGANHLLRFSLKPERMRLGRIESKPKASPSPHPFVMLLRRDVIGKRLSEISQINRDRVVIARFGRQGTDCSLVAELTSRHANLFFLDASDIVTGVFHPDRTLSRVATGSPYMPPRPLPGPTRPSRFPDGRAVEAAIERHYRAEDEETTLSLERQLLRKMVRTAKKRQQRLIDRLERDLSNAERGTQLEHLAHILKGRLREAQRGVTALDTTDFEGNPVTIPLDPRLSPTQNMDRLFTKSKRLGRAVEQIEGRMLTAMEVQSELEECEHQADRAEGLQAIARLSSRLVRRFPYLKQVENRERNTKDTRLPYREYLVSGNRPVRVGRSARDNDTLTLRHAKPNDLWLHVRGESGSHVVAPLGRDEDPPPELLVDAAHLAAHFSKLSREKDVEVIYTRRRYVQKPRGAPPGSVRLIKEKTLLLTMEPERIARILTNRALG